MGDIQPIRIRLAVNGNGNGFFAKQEWGNLAILVLYGKIKGIKNSILFFKKTRKGMGRG